MQEEIIVLCGSNSYEKKYYINEKFAGLPTQIKQELQIMCVLFTEEVGGIFILKFDEEGVLQLETQCDEGDLLYDEIGAELKIRQIQRTKAELLEGLETYYRVFIKGENL